jgi:hypothetical protein
MVDDSSHANEEDTASLTEHLTFPCQIFWGNHFPLEFFKFFPKVLALERNMRAHLDACVLRRCSITVTGCLYDSFSMSPHMQKQPPNLAPRGQETRLRSVSRERGSQHAGYYQVNYDISK